MKKLFKIFSIISLATMAMFVIFCMVDIFFLYDSVINNIASAKDSEVLIFSIGVSFWLIIWLFGVTFWLQVIP